MPDEKFAAVIFVHDIPSVAVIALSAFAAFLTVFFAQRLWVRAAQREIVREIEKQRLRVRNGHA